VTRYRLDSQFHCSYLESRGVPEKTREIPGKKTRGKWSPFHFRFTTSGDVIYGDATSGDVIFGRACAHDHFRNPLIAPPQMLSGWCFYTTVVLHNRGSKTRYGKKSFSYEAATLEFLLPTLNTNYLLADGIIIILWNLFELLNRIRSNQKFYVFFFILSYYKKSWIKRFRWRHKGRYNSELF
jgi:hypothetical protein